MMKKSMTKRAAYVLFFAIVLLSLIHALTVRKAYSLSQQTCVLLAEYLSQKITAEIQRPIQISRSMAMSTDEFSSFLASAQNPENDSEIQAYLSRIKKEFSLAEVSFVSEKTHTFYYANGEKSTDVQENDLGAWYIALKGGAKGILSVYRTDEDAKDSTLRFSARIEQNGEFLGVVMTSIYVRDLLALFALLEKQYNVKINLSNSTGLVMLDTNFVDIDTASVAWLLPKNNADDSFRYIRTGVTSYAVSGRAGVGDWYFVMRGSEPFSPSQLFYLCAIFVFGAGLTVLYALRKQSHFADYRPKITANSSQTDPLTLLPNRNFFKDTFGERGVFNTTRYQSLAVFDIDFFKEANDTLNGNDVLVAVVKEMLYLLANRGMVLRWGGDEFLVLFEMPIDNAYALCRQFVRNIKDAGLVTVSVGLTEVRISDKIKKNYYRAACLCYNVKELGGNGVKRG